MFQNQMPEPNHRFFSFMCSWQCQKGWYCIQMQNNKKKYGIRGEEEEKRRGGKKRGHSINATGHRPFKIFKIKKVLLLTSTFHFSSFLQFSWLFTYLKKKIISNSTSQMIHKFIKYFCHLSPQTVKCWQWVENNISNKSLQFTGQHLHLYVTDISLSRI